MENRKYLPSANGFGALIPSLGLGWACKVAHKAYTFAQTQSMHSNGPGLQCG
jgi:hypothetical protein